MTSAKAALESLAIGTEKRIAVVLEIGSAYTRYLRRVIGRPRPLIGCSRTADAVLPAKVARATSWRQKCDAT